MDKEKVNLLKWFVNYVYSDIDSLEHGEKIGLTAEVHFLLSNGLWSDFTHSETMAMAHNVVGSENYNQATFTRVKELQTSFRGYFDSMIAKFEEFAKLDHFDKWIKPQPLKPGGFVLTDEKPHLQLTIGIDPTIPVETKESKDGFLIRGVPDWRRQITIVSSVEHDRSEAILFLIFARCLHQVSWRVFRKCEGCGHWFVHVTKREKKFCSNLCAARSANRARRKRQKDTKAYEKELERNAGRARKSYVRKIKGSSNIKVQRRPTKYK